MLTLCVKEPDGGSRELCIDCSTHTIGKGKSNDIVLTDHTVSNTHAWITCENDQYSIEALEGTGGVYINNEKIGKKTHFNAGATIKIGGTTMEVSLLAAYEGKTMVMFSPDEDTPLPFDANTTSDCHGKEEPTVLMPEDEIPTLRGEFASKKMKPGPEKPPRVKKPVFYFIAFTIFLIMACLFYFQIRPFVNKLGKSESTNTQTRLKDGQDLAGGKKPETKQVVDNDKPVDYRGTEKENRAAHNTRSEMNDAGRAKELFHQGLSHYINGNLEKSLEAFDHIASLDLAEENPLKTNAALYRKMIHRAGILYHGGKTAYDRGQPEAAFKVWAQLLEIDQHLIGQKSSHFSGSISRYMCREFAKRAQRAFENADYATAHENNQKALMINPGLETALAIKKRLTERAHKLYEKGHILEALDPEMAAIRWQEVLSICSPEDEIYKKAGRRLADH